MHLRAPYSFVRLLAILTSLLLPLHGLSITKHERHISDISDPPEENISMNASAWKLIIITVLVSLGGVFAGELCFYYYCLKTNVSILTPTKTNKEGVRKKQRLIITSADHHISDC
jgi:hypothetical protein